MTGLQMMTNHHNHSKYVEYTHQQFLSLNLKVMERIEDLFAVLDIDNFAKDGKRYVFACPIHGGDNVTAFNIYHHGYYCIGNWKCRSHQCHEHFTNSVIGFTRGILSHQRYNWTSLGDQTISIQETVNYLLKFLNTSISDLHINISKKEQRRFVNGIQSLSIKDNKKMISRQQVRDSLNIPAEYYIKRGFSPQTLRNYDVGVCTNSRKPMYNRVVIPVYDNKYEYMIGCTGRSIYEKCNKCGTYHNPRYTTCPKKKYKKRYGKWRHSKGFSADATLYNYWFAAEHIKKEQSVILVEGPGDVWKLHEAGIYNCVGIFGNELSNKQRMVLNGSGALSIIVILDNDENGAGQKGAQSIKTKCERIYNINVITPSKNDIGDMSVEEIKQEIIPQIKVKTNE